MAEPVPTRVAFLGLGLMGSRMAANLAAAGFEVAVWNRTRAAADEFAARTGATVAETAGAAVATAEVVVSMLADGAVTEGVYLGPGGALASLRPGTVVIDMGTSGPDTVARLAEAVAERGGQLLDAPVSGSTDAARTASLVVLVGGPAAAVHRVRPVLAALSSTVHHVGESGAGALLKLAINNVLFALTAAVAEALVLAERGGIAPEAAYDAFCDSAIGAPAVRYRREAMLHPDTAAPSFRLRLAAKDLRLAADQAARVGAVTPQAAAAAALIDAAVAQGLGDADLAALQAVLRRE